jgi:hypothetical protein
MAIGTYIDRHNESPKPFTWTARADDILERVKRTRRTLNKRHSARRTTRAASGDYLRNPCYQAFALRTLSERNTREPTASDWLR